MPFRNTFYVIMALTLSSLSYAMDGAGYAAARTQEQARQAQAIADQQARDANWRRIQAQWAAERAAVDRAAAAAAAAAARAAGQRR